MNKIPLWLRTALQKEYPKTQIHARNFLGPRVGDIYLAWANQHRRIVVILERWEKFVEIALCSNLIELASDKDIGLDQESCPFPALLMIHLDLLSPILQSQLEECYGRIPQPLLSKVLSAALEGKYHELPPSMRGMPIQGRQDARWEWKLRELQVLHALGQKAAQELLA